MTHRITDTCSFTRRSLHSSSLLLLLLKEYYDYDYDYDYNDEYDDY
jgi:hypothetical protein